MPWCIYRAFGDTCVTFGVGRSIFARLYMLDEFASYVLLSSIYKNNIFRSVIFMSIIFSNKHILLRFVNEENRPARPVESPSDSPVHPETSSQKAQTPSQQAKTSSSNPLPHRPSSVPAQHPHPPAQTTLLQTPPEDPSHAENCEED